MWFNTNCFLCMCWRSQQVQNDEKLLLLAFNKKLTKSGTSHESYIAHYPLQIWHLHLYNVYKVKENQKLKAENAGNIPQVKQNLWWEKWRSDFRLITFLSDLEFKKISYRKGRGERKHKGRYVFVWRSGLIAWYGGMICGLKENDKGYWMTQCMYWGVGRRKWNMKLSGDNKIQCWKLISETGKADYPTLLDSFMAVEGCNVILKSIIKRGKKMKYVKFSWRNG